MKISPKSIFKKLFKTSIIITGLVIIVFLGGVVGIMVAGGEWFYREIYMSVPTEPTIKPQYLQTASYYFDSEGAQLYQEYYDVNRTLIKFESLPKDLVNAIIAIEDEDFYNHSGVSVRAIVRAAYSNYVLKNSGLQGGSTLTQQLAKNVFLSQERTIKRKLVEVMYAYRLEQLYTKNEILSYYLNTVSFGGTAYGIEAGAQTYFGKHVEELDLAESALLAGLPASPTNLNPYSNLENLKERQKTVLFAMAEQKYITWAQVHEAFKKELKIIPPSTQIKYPHFVHYTRSFIATQLGEEVLKKGGLKVYTTIEPYIQSIAESAISTEMTKLRGLNISNAATLVTHNQSGEIRAMVGSIDYYNQTIKGNVNLTTSLRQPGSSIKPFNYALYLSNGKTLSTLINDSPVTYRSAWESYSPVNYDSKFRGNVTVRRALSNSLNIPAVKALEANGVEPFVNFMKNLGFDPWREESWGLALTLGSGEVRMVNMNQGYAIFPNLGKQVGLTPVKYIENNVGEVIYFNPCLYKAEDFSDRKVTYSAGSCSREVISPEVSFLITSVLIDNKTRSEAFGPNSALNVPGTGAKTGTTNDFKDNWTFGFNQEFTVGAWVGNNDNRPMSRVVSGVTGAAPIWNKVIVPLTNNENSINIDNLKPSSINKIKVCAASDAKVCGTCSVDEYYIVGTEPTRFCPPPPPPPKKEEEKEEDHDD